MVIERRLEFLVAVEAILWSIWISNPWWDAFASSATYDWMAHLMPEWIWGLGIGLLGVGQLIVALWGRSVKLHLGMALVNLFAWILITISFALANWHSTAVIIYSFFVAAQTLIYIDSLTVWKRRRNGKINVE